MPVKIKYQILICALLLSTAPPLTQANAIACPDLRIVFADGLTDDGYSGPVQKDKNYIGFKSAIESKLQSTNLTYDFISLDYPITSIGLENFRTEIDGYVAARNAHTLEDSIRQGINNLTKIVNNQCEDTKYIIGGFSQGALVVSGALQTIDANKVIYVATFGDPKIHLPEGIQACNRENLSPYRTYVPDCRAESGLLGAKNPYQETNYNGKLGTWCNTYDVYCSAHLNAAHHTTYYEDGLYENATSVIFNKITDYFNIKNSAKLFSQTNQTELVGADQSFYPEKPTLTISSVKQISSTEIKVEFDYDYSGAIVIMDDQVLGLTVKKELTVSNLNPDEEHILALVPIKKTLLGSRVEVKLKTINEESETPIPKAPNTGRK